MEFHRRWAVTALFVVALGASSIAHAAAISGQGTWETTLQARDLDGNLTTVEAYYDTALDVTWVADVKIGYGSYYDTILGSPRNGLMTWEYANLWAASLNFNGITGWRLPTTVDADGPDADALGNDGCSYTNFYQGIDCGYNITTHSELSYMFYVTLGNKAYYTTSGGYEGRWGAMNSGPFINLGLGDYWSATKYVPNSGYAWIFDFLFGDQTYRNTSLSDERGVWAVHSGDIGAAVVPVPAAVWLFGSGLLGLLGVNWKRRR